MTRLKVKPTRSARKRRQSQLAALSLVLLAGLTGGAVPVVEAAPKTVCTVTINSPDERDTFQRFLPPDQYRFVELVQRGVEARCVGRRIGGHGDDLCADDLGVEGEPSHALSTREQRAHAGTIVVGESVKNTAGALTPLGAHPFYETETGRG